MEQSVEDKKNGYCPNNCPLGFSATNTYHMLTSHTLI
jgi:hypothetical protein